MAAPAARSVDPVIAGSMLSGPGETGVVVVADSWRAEPAASDGGVRTPRR